MYIHTYIHIFFQTFLYIVWIVMRIKSPFLLVALPSHNYLKVQNVYLNFKHTRI